MRNGERSTISTRCADLDQQMPISLGVSKAILEYVIFCHQEESTWPLSEPGVLKKHFDEIFEALKYTKALDQIKAVRKEQLVTVKIDNVELGHLRANKERASKIQAESDELLEKVATLRTRIKALDSQMTEALEDQNELFRSGEEFERIIAELDRYRHEHKIMKETHDDLMRNIVEYKDTSEELQAMQDNFAGTMKQQGDLLIDMRSQVANRKRSLKLVREQLDEGISTEGHLRAEAEQHERQITKRLELIKSISRAHNMRGYDMSLDEQQIGDFKSRLNQLVKTQTKSLENLKASAREQERKISEELQVYLVHHAEFESGKSSNRSQILKLERKVLEMQQKIDRGTDVAIDSGQIDQETRHIEDKIRKTQAESEKGDWTQRIKEKQNELATNEINIDNLNKAIHLGNRQADTRAKLTLLKTEEVRKNENLRSMTATIESQFTAITKKAFDTTTLANDLRQARSIAETDMMDAKTASDTINKEISQLEAQMSLKHDALATKRQQVKDYTEQVEDVFAERDADDVIGTIEKNLHESRDHLYQAQHADKLYDRALDYAEEKGSCQMCNRAFDKQFSVDQFCQLINMKKSKVPKHLENARNAIVAYTAKLNEYKAVEPARIALSSLQQDVPKLETELDELREALQNAAERWESAGSRVAEFEKIVGVVSNLERVGSDIARVIRELEDTKRQIRSLEDELRASGASKSVEDVQAELNQLQEGSKAIRRAVEELNDKRDTAKSMLQALDGRRRDLQLRQSELQSRMREHEALKTQISEHRESIEKSTADIEAAEKKDSQEKPIIESLRTDLEQTRQQNNDEESKLQRDLGKLVTAQNSLNAVEADIEAYLQSSGPQSLQDICSSLARLRTEIGTLEQQIDTTNQEIHETEVQISDLQNTERNINDNLRLRKVREDIARVKRQIVELESKNAERDREQYVLDSKRLKDRYSKLITERAGLLGEIAQMDNQLKQKQKELSGEFADADENYRTKLICVRTMEKANEDLDKYGKALDNAIMKYHSLKMEEINKIIDELWKATYCGTDVDSISIRSEGESQAANRSYNYRVCMVKGEAELDMRGRCSAGQKVLAAIIIRLALAECFGVNCGILALDEPTTNLDRDNIESLAKSLANIIAARRSQRNFQLIVITHDEEFLRLMGCSDYCDHYYRVCRNEHQKSEIVKQRVSTVI